ncbi:DNA cytosine methyltransferase [Macrococcus equi]|uniref:DNA cytosine methyltransferase n=1 Tax=Macrococcus equi TaxID=3395462 RepID=UPI0039BDDB47
MSDIIAIDLFSGAGGTTSGLKKAGINVKVAVELDSTACLTYAKNNPEVTLLNENIVDVTSTRLKKLINLDSNEKLILVACPPCQGFSTIRKNGDSDPRNMLIFEYLRLIKELRPHYLLMENVVGLTRNNGKKIFELFLEELSEYEILYDILNAADYGVPQTRKRLVLHGKRNDLENEKLILPVPTHSKNGGDLKKWKTASVILGLPKLQAGEHYEGENIFNHVCHKISPLNKERMNYIRNHGGSRLSLPENLQLSCHKNYTGHSDVYGIIDINRPVSTITGGCMNYTKGRYGHPFENRALSAREAARLQTFDDDYIFIGNKGELAKQIGNAVPVSLAQASGTVFINLQNRGIDNE